MIQLCCTWASNCRSFVCNPGKRRSPIVSVILDVDESITFDVIFQAAAAHRSQGQIRLSVVDNQYEDSIIQLVAEGYQDDISIDNIQSVVSMETESEMDLTVADDDIRGIVLLLKEY